MRTKLVAVAPSATITPSAASSPQKFSTFISEEGEEKEDDGSGFTGSYEGDSTRHPLRQVLVEVEVERENRERREEEREVRTVASSLSLGEDSLSGSIGSRSVMSFSVSQSPTPSLLSSSYGASKSKGRSETTPSKDADSTSRSGRRGERSTRKSTTSLYSESRASSQSPSKSFTASRHVSEDGSSVDDLSYQEGDEEADPQWLSSAEDNHYVSRDDRAAMRSQLSLPSGDGMPKTNKFGRLRYRPREYVRTKKGQSEEEKKMKNKWAKVHEYHFL
jgi:hypothetical protein